MSFKPGGVAPPPRGTLCPAGSGLDINTGPECSAFWPCPPRVHPLVSWLQPFGGWPRAKGELRLLALFFKKERLHTLKLKKKKKDVGLWSGIKKVALGATPSSRQRRTRALISKQG